MAGRVAVVAQHSGGRLHPVFLEAVSGALALGREIGSPVDAVLMGEGVGDLANAVAQLGVRRVLVVDAPQLASYTPGAYAAAVDAALADEPPAWVVFGHTYQSVDLMARVAHRLGAGILPEALGFATEVEGLVWRRPILEGKLQARVRVRGEAPMVVSFQSAAFEAAAASSAGEVVAIAADSSIAPDRELLGVEDVAGDAVDLSAAERIVAAGRGIGGAEKMSVIEDLAAALHAEIGASRPVIDNGWLPRDRQIGSSGQTVSPKLYLAVGISGAIQHLVGMKGAACTVAINKDPGAPIFTVADYGIVADLFEVVPALVQALRDAEV